jgi:protein phosphatase
MDRPSLIERNCPATFAHASLPRAVAALSQARERLHAEHRERLEATMQAYQCRERDVEAFVAAYRRYCWPVTSVSDLKLAPFHLLATEGHVHTGKNHLWHLETLAGICQHDSRRFFERPDAQPASPNF